MTTVPSPREFLTSVVNTLSAYNPAEHQAHPNQQHQRHHHHYADHPPSNPLKLIPNPHRALLSTLHVLYPSILLPALDLLDRRLVTRVVVANSSSSNNNDSTNSDTKNARPEEASLQRTRTFHLVRSAQQQQQSTTTSRRRHHHHNHNTTLDSVSIAAALAGSGRGATTIPAAPAPAPASGGKVYVVRLDAWNCSCAAFAFSAFPPEATSRFPQHQSGPGAAGSSAQTSLLARLKSEGPGAGQARSDDHDLASRTRASDSGYEIFPAASHDEHGIHGDAAQTNRSWECGGFSIDGLPGSGIVNVPCCKHLLACLLGERWSSVLGEYVQERRVGREEGAGLMSDV
ncbi:uncharacterized protein B0I36DRAFT_12796 [Microdochium trichocladiopsis]|uniref:SWIM-type domain-containing protein n=1 Tax=Microdochium trichocladiopsis TaxID=1682393 RepID=A0A9P8YJJ7_9PEZI|nr:uncharacterized protein B0I36DRAFT_12796 [Microdochium trichocladiopsis]KAH7040591.1 hypothetical protein B0I36DRAFT_12796 [Microdochium trichocladiopsis]